jgi:hypothetical protein
VATPANPVLSQAAQEPPKAPPAAATLAAAVTPATEPLAPMMTTNALEASLRPPPVPAEWRDATHDTLRPSHVDPPAELSAAAFRAQKPWRALAAAAIVVLVGVIWLVASSISSESDTVAALPPASPKQAPSRAPAALSRQAVKQSSTTTATVTPATNPNPSGFADSFKSALSGTADATPVTVHVSPPNAVVFKYGQRIGTGEVTVNVARGTKTTLVVQLDGYLPRTVVVDGTNASVNIVLSQMTPQQKSVAASSSPKSKSNNSAVARAGEPSEGTEKNEDTRSSDAPSNSTSASDSELNKPSPPASKDTSEADPISDVDPL